MSQKLISLTLIVFFSILSSKAQIGYSVFSSGGQYFLYSIDLSTCEVCQLSIGIPFGDAELGEDLTMLPNGNWVSNNSCTLIVMSSPPNSTILYELNTPGTECIRGTVYDEINDIVYVLAQDGLYIFDPNTFAYTLVGQWPISWGMPSMAGIHFTNGVLYGTAVFTPGGYQLFEIDINDPSNSTILYSLFVNDGQGSSPNGFLLHMEWCFW